MSTVLRQPLQATQPVRLPGDFLGTRRVSNWTGGYNRRKLEDYYGQANVPPMFWDAQNINWWDKEGAFFLCSAFFNIGAQDSDDKEYLFFQFNNALYRFPTANLDATKAQKISSAAGAPSWGALGASYPGAAVKGGVIWRNQLVLAEGGVGANALRVMSAADAWSLIAAAAPAPTTAAALQVGISPDDRLLCWFDSNGLFAWDGTNWTKIFPTAAANIAVDPFCDLIFRGSGSTIFVTRDSAGKSTLYEYFIEPTGTGFRVWMSETGMRVWPQGAEVYDNATFLVGRLGNAGNIGFFIRKEYLGAPEILDLLDTNEATDGLAGQDWSWRCIRAVGDALWIGGSSREDRDAALWRYFVDESGQVLGPGPVIDGISGPIYSIGVIPAQGGIGSERIHVAVTRATYYKDADGGTDPTKDAPAGFIQNPDIDYGTDDREKVGRVAQIFLRQKSLGGTVDMKYRVDPSMQSDPWRSLGQAIQAKLTEKEFPHDNELAALYGTAFRSLQTRIELARATSGIVRDVIDTFLVDVAENRALGSR